MGLWLQSAMEESDCKLLQPTVFAFTFLLLIVMNLEQVRSTEEIKVMYHAFSRKFLTMHDNGSVNTVNNVDEYTKNQCMVLSTVEKPQYGKPLILSIYNPHTKNYLCFNKAGNLIGRRRCTDMCLFTETVDEGSHLVYKLANHCQKRSPIMAFSKDGKPQRRRNKKNTNAQILKIKPDGDSCADAHLNDTIFLRHKHCRPRKPRHCNV